MSYHLYVSVGISTKSSNRVVKIRCTNSDVTIFSENIVERRNLVYATNDPMHGKRKALKNSQRQLKNQAWQLHSPLTVLHKQQATAAHIL